MIVDANTFIAAAFPASELQDGVVGVCEGTFRCVAHDPDLTSALVAGTRPTYMVVSTLDGRKRLTKEGLESSDLGRARANCREAWVFVLDDVGTKAVAPSVEPSYKIQTSVKDGVANYQWGYFLSPFDVSTPEGVAYYEACCRAAGLAGISDRGMRGVYRICRVPGSLHSSGFRAVVVDWEPDRAWELPVLMAELGLDVEAAMKGASRRVTRESKVADPVLEWLIGRGDVGQTLGDWVEIVCPNHAEHSDGSEVAGYSPLDHACEGRQFKCFHGHCDAWDTKTFLAWVEAEGGPSVGAFGPDPVTASEREVLSHVIPRAELPMEIVAEMEDEAMRMEILREWRYCEAERSYFRLDGDGRPCEFLSAEGFNNKVGKWMPSTRDGKKAAVRWWRECADAKMVHSIDFRPDLPTGEYYEDETLRINAYVPFIPAKTGFLESVSALWDRHLQLLFGDEAGLLKCWMAWVVQHPGQRVNWCPVLQGIPGCGKTLIGQALAAAVGRQYVAEVGPGAFSDSFNTFMEGKLLVLGEEIRVSGQNRFAVLDSLKTLMTNDFIDVRGMRKVRRTIRNTASYMVFTNHDDAIPLDQAERRWAVFSAVIETPGDLLTGGLDGAYFSALADSIREQPGAIYSWLKAVDLKAFDPKGRAPETVGSAEMIEISTDSLYDLVLNEIKSGKHLNANEAICLNSAVLAITQILNRRGGGDRRLPEESRWRAYLRQHGWVSVTRKYWGADGPTRVWVNTVYVKEGKQVSTDKITAVLRDKNEAIVSVSNVINMNRKLDKE